MTGATAYAAIVYTSSSTFTEPTTNEDGTPLIDLAGYRVEILREGVVIHTQEFQAARPDPQPDSNVTFKVGPLEDVTTGE